MKQLTVFLLSALLILSAASCAPRFAALSGPAYGGPLPRAELTGYRMLNFDWEYQDAIVSNRGEGTIRIASPDSARLDLFLRSGMGRLQAILIGMGPVTVSTGDDMTRLLPSPELIWAALGRLAVPPARDTVARVIEGRIVADIGADTVYRATFEGDRLTRLEKGVGRRQVERVTRSGDGAVSYARGKTTLRIHNMQERDSEPFDPAIWRH
jgi:hypothetical protein